MLPQQRHDLLMRQQAEAQDLGAGSYRRRKVPQMLADEHKQRLNRGLLENFQQGVAGLDRQLAYIVEDSYFHPPLVGLQRQGLPQLPDLIDLNDLPLGLDEVDIRVQMALDAQADRTLLARIAVLGWAIERLR
jgi:hypothetical protein